MRARRRKKSQPTTDLAERIQSILALKDLTLYQVSQRSEKLYGRSSPYFLPHNLYFDLRSGTFSPSIYQFLALSRITGYRLPDWVRLFGVDLENIARLQTSLPSRRTILLESSLADPYAWISWFRNRIGDRPAPPVTPLGQLLEPFGATRSLAPKDSVPCPKATVGVSYTQRSDTKTRLLFQTCSQEALCA